MRVAETKTPPYLCESRGHVFVFRAHP